MAEGKYGASFDKFASLPPSLKVECMYIKILDLYLQEMTHQACYFVEDVWAFSLT